MKDNTLTKKSQVEKRTKWVIEQMLSDHKKLRNEENHFIKITKPYLLYFFKNRYFFSLTSQTDRQKAYKL